MRNIDICFAKQLQYHSCRESRWEGNGTGGHGTTVGFGRSSEINLFSLKNISTKLFSNSRSAQSVFCVSSQMAARGLLISTTHLKWENIKASVQLKPVTPACFNSKHSARQVIDSSEQRFNTFGPKLTKKLNSLWFTACCSVTLGTQTQRYTSNHA